MVPNDFLQAARRRQRTTELAKPPNLTLSKPALRLTAVVLMGAKPNSALRETTSRLFYAGFDSDIKEAFKVLSGGEKTIELPGLAPLVTNCWRPSAR